MPKYLDVTEKSVYTFRKVFGTADGRAVLGWMLSEMGTLGPDPQDEYGRGQADYGKRLLRLCGILHPKNTTAIIDAFLAVPPAWGSPPRRPEKELVRSRE